MHHLTTGMWQRPPIHHAPFPRKVTHRFRNQPRTTRWPAISCRMFCTNLKPEPLVTHMTHHFQTLTQDLRSKSARRESQCKKFHCVQDSPIPRFTQISRARRTTINGRVGTVTLTRRRRRDRNVAHCANTEFSTYRNGEQVPPTETHISDLTRFT